MVLPKHLAIVKDLLSAAEIKRIRAGEKVCIYVRITPDMAAAFLEGNTHNRILRPRAVAKYIRALRNGDAKTTHQGIAFSEDGTMVDGQHRLWAILEASIAWELPVNYNIPIETQSYIDSGASRNNADKLKLAGYQWATKRHSAILGLMGDSTRKVEMTPAEIQKHADDYQDGVCFVVNALKGRSEKGVTVAPVLAPCARAYYRRGVNRTRIAEFLEVVVTGLSNGAQDSAAIRLRNAIKRALEQRNPMRKERVYKLTESALAHFLKEEGVRQLKPIEREVFPLPHERRAAPADKAAARMRLPGKKDMNMDRIKAILEAQKRKHARR